eukprot:UN03488
MGCLSAKEGIKCDECNGKKVNSISPIATIDCQKCSGKGELNMMRGGGSCIQCGPYSATGISTFQCSSCSGTGKETVVYFKIKCPKCKGSGVTCLKCKGSGRIPDPVTT